MAARPPSPRSVAGWILRCPETLTEPEQLQLKNISANCPEIAALTRHIWSFATMVTEHQGERLPDWLDAVRRVTSPASTPSPQDSNAIGTPSSPA
ncbi:hypothetical protein ACIPUC_00400 [Streptomyces sp. LARHCF249]